VRQRWQVKIYTLPKQIPGYAPAYDKSYDKSYDKIDLIEFGLYSAMHGPEGAILDILLQQLAESYTLLLMHRWVS